MSSQFRLQNMRASTYALFLLGSFLVLIMNNPVLAVRIVQGDAVVPGVESDLDVKSVDPKSDVDSAKQPGNAATVASAVAAPAAPEAKIDMQKEAAGLEALNEYMEDVELGLIGTSQDSDLFENALKKIATEKKVNEITSTPATTATPATSVSSVDKQQAQQQQQQVTQSADAKQEGLSDYDLQVSQQLETINQFLFSESTDEIVLNQKNDVKVISSNKVSGDGATTAGAQDNKQEKGKDEKNVQPATTSDTSAVPAIKPETNADANKDDNNKKPVGESESESEEGVKKEQLTSGQDKQSEGEDKSGETIGESDSKAPANLIQRTHKITHMHMNREEQSRNWSYWAFGILVGGTILFMLIANLDRVYKLLHPNSRHITKLTQEETEFLAAKQSCEQMFNLQDSEALVF